MGANSTEAGLAEVELSAFSGTFGLAPAPSATETGFDCANWLLLLCSKSANQISRAISLAKALLSLFLKDTNLPDSLPFRNTSIAGTSGTS